MLACEERGGETAAKRTATCQTRGWNYTYVGQTRWRRDEGGVVSLRGNGKETVETFVFLFFFFSFMNDPFATGKKKQFSVEFLIFLKEISMRRAGFFFFTECSNSFNK